MKRYFIAQCDDDGEVINEDITEVAPPPTWRAVIEAFILGVAIGIGVTIILL